MSASQASDGTFAQLSCSTAREAAYRLEAGVGGLDATLDFGDLLDRGLAEVLGAAIGDRSAQGLDPVAGVLGPGVGAPLQPVGGQSGTSDDQYEQEALHRQLPTRPVREYSTDVASTTTAVVLIAA